jgi:hypothetical protein
MSAKVEAIAELYFARKKKIKELKRKLREKIQKNKNLLRTNPFLGTLIGSIRKAQPG